MSGFFIFSEMYKPHDEIRLNQCRHCSNRLLNPEKGLCCKLTIQPKIVDNKCLDFIQDSTHAEIRSYHSEKANRAERKRDFLKNVKSGLILGLLAFTLVYLISAWWNIEKDHKYTVAQSHVYRITGNDKTLWWGGYCIDIEYAFHINGTRYYDKGSVGCGRRGKLSQPIRPEQVLIKFSTSDPSQHSIIWNTNVEHINISQLPAGGIEPEELEKFLELNEATQ